MACTEVIMDTDFWLQRWQQNQIGFHKAEVNAYLKDYWDALGVAPPARVLVPLCGKSLDMLWLMEQGYQVEGVELSPLAIEAFFAEQGLAAEQREIDGWRVWQYDRLRLWCGDFFALGKAQLGRIDAIYDRAALIALPAEMRPRYAEHVCRLGGGARCLLVTLDYPQEQMSGPPFAVSPAEVARLYQAAVGTEPLRNRDVLTENPHLRERGLGSLHEAVYRLQIPKN